MSRWCRLPPLTFTAGFIALVGLAVVTLRDRDVLLYNHSPSLPVGLYVRTEDALRPGAVVTVRAADVAPELAAERRFAGPRDRFLKRVAASAGDEVCAQADAIVINGAQAALRHEHDSHGVLLPQWSGCRQLAADELFLMGDTADSFDGRYWGVVSRNTIEGVWRPVHAASSDR